MHTFSKAIAVVLAVCFAAYGIATPATAQAPDPANSNFWPVHRDPKLGFRISYPANWLPVPGRGPNVKFSVNPPSGAGNCNVVAKPNVELARLSQSDLNAEIRALGIDAPSWAEYVGIPSANIRVLSARRAAVSSIPAIVGVLEADLENLQGKYVRRQIVAMTLTPQAVWTMNCGVFVATTALAAQRFNELAPLFEKVLGSFAFQP